MVHVHPYHTRTVPFERRARYTRTLSQVDVREKLERNKRTNWHRSRSPYDIYHLQPLACDLLRRLLIEKTRRNISHQRTMLYQFDDEYSSDSSLKMGMTLMTRSLVANTIIDVVIEEAIRFTITKIIFIILTLIIEIIIVTIYISEIIVIPILRAAITTDS